MIAELIFAALMGALIAYIIYRFCSTYEKRKINKNIAEKIEKQDKKFFDEGKEVKRIIPKANKPKEEKTKSWLSNLFKK